MEGRDLCLEVQILILLIGFKVVWRGALVRTQTQSDEVPFVIAG